jgi:hypothetical protein
VKAGHNGWTAASSASSQIRAESMKDTVKETIDGKLKECPAASEHQRYLRERLRRGPREYITCRMRYMTGPLVQHIVSS